MGNLILHWYASRMCGILRINTIIFIYFVSTIVGQGIQQLDFKQQAFKNGPGIMGVATCHFSLLGSENLDRAA